jgi:hypothetical protein
MPTLTPVDHQCFDPDDTGDADLRISCDGCPARRLGVCEDCIVTVVLDAAMAGADEEDW